MHGPPIKPLNICPPTIEVCRRCHASFGRRWDERMSYLCGPNWDGKWICYHLDGDEAWEAQLLYCPTDRSRPKRKAEAFVRAWAGESPARNPADPVPSDCPFIVEHLVCWAASKG